MEELRARFKPEFLNRLDDVIFFHRLEEDDLVSIAGRMLDSVRGRLSGMGVSLEASQDALRRLADPGKEREQGARPIRRAVRRYVEQPAADLLLSQAVGKGDTLCLAVAGDQLTLQPQK